MHAAARVAEDIGSTDVAVAVTADVTDAAAELGVSQPALSRALARFEEQVGALLFDRAPLLLVLTLAARAGVVDRVHQQPLSESRIGRYGKPLDERARRCRLLPGALHRARPATAIGRG